MMRLINNVLSGLAVLAFTSFLAVCLVEWLSGCGETYTDSKGVVHQNDCVFIVVPTK